jgi:hypothetical protein
VLTESKFDPRRKVKRAIGDAEARAIQCVDAQSTKATFQSVSMEGKCHLECLFENVFRKRTM